MHIASTVEQKGLAPFIHAPARSFLKKTKTPNLANRCSDRRAKGARRAQQPWTAPAMSALSDTLLYLPQVLLLIP